MRESDAWDVHFERKNGRRRREGGREDGLGFERVGVRVPLLLYSLHSKGELLSIIYI